MAHVRDGFLARPRVRQNGVRGVLDLGHEERRLDHADRSGTARDAAGGGQRCRPTGILPLFDQSLFVKASIDGVVREVADRGLPDRAMILLFLGNCAAT